MRLLDTLNSEMMQAFNGVEELGDLPEGEDSEEDGKTATFPFLNRLFSGNDAPRAAEEAPGEGGSRRKEERKDGKKRKFLESYCISLTQRAKDGKLDPVIGRAQEIERVVQVPTAARRTIPALSASRASARRPSLRGWPSASPRGMCPSSCGTRKSICWT